MDYFVLAILFTVTGAQASQLEGPQNTLGVVGSTVTLKCSSPLRNCSGIDWQKYMPGSIATTIFKGPRTIILNTNITDRNRYSVNNSSGCDLVIKNVQLADAGRFICSAIVSSSQTTTTAHLIILATENRPNCTLVTSWHELATGDEVKLNCEVTHNGTNRVLTDWRGPEDVPVYARKGNARNRFYFVVPSAPEVPSFTCIVSFPVESDDSGVAIVGLATNRPTQKATCATPVVKVLPAQQFRVEEPQNTLRIVGSTVILKCFSPSRSCNGIEWLKYSAGNTTTVYNDYQGISLVYGDRYSVDGSSSCDLIIRNVQLTDAGRFLCRAVLSSSVIYERLAYLIILETQPTCSMYASLHDTVEGEGVQLNCMSAYNDRNTISMVWTGVDDAPAAMKSGSNLIWSYYVVASAPEIPSLTCSSSITVLRNDIDGVPFTHVGLARNIPNASCATSAIKVLHTVRDVQLSPSSFNYSPGSRVLCMAKGYPAPTLQWQEMENDSSWTDIKNRNGYEFTMTNVSHKRYRCVAMNVVRSKAYYAASHEFLVIKTESVKYHKIREEYPMSEDPDLYCKVDQLEDALATDKPRFAAPTSEPPIRPKHHVAQLQPVRSAPYH